MHGRSHLVVPYSLVVNDARYIIGTGYGSPEHFFETAKACLDRLRNDGDDLGRMMSIGLHPRITGNPARSDALARFIAYAQQFEDVTVHAPDRYCAQLCGAGAPALIADRMFLPIAQLFCAMGYCADD